MSNHHQFLVELGTEELPPTALSTLSKAFERGVAEGLKAANLSVDSIIAFATPRRLALLVDGLPAATPTKELTVWGPPVAVAFKEGVATKAAEAFAKKNGLEVSALQIANDGKVDKLVHTTEAGGEATTGLLPGIVEVALSQLPINKRMRWGSSREEFVRPVHWLVMLLDEDVVAGRVLGVEAGRVTRGHRFHSSGEQTIAQAKEYQQVLQSVHVAASFESRKATIAEQVTACGQALGGHAVIDDDLLDEVTALVEWPVAIAGKFDQEFLAVPAEALISSMKEHQKYFHVVDGEGQLLPHFITVSNIESTDVSQVIEGNEKVIRPRLADAKFFFEQDQKTSLETQREKLKKMVFQAKLGTLFDKTERIAQLAKFIAEQMDADGKQAERAGQLSKADLVTSMVYEFADMQGIAGEYYAKNDGESEAVAKAIAEQYLPKFAKDTLPESNAGTAVALADRLDTLAGIFGLGQVPTGSKDPFALRRASVAVLRLLIENQLALDLKALLEKAASLHDDLPKGDDTITLALNYMLERLRSWYEEEGIDIAVYQAVQAKGLSEPLDIHQRIHAVAAFAKLPEAEALAAANKRVSNILAKQASEPTMVVDTQLLKEPAEQALAAQLSELLGHVEPLLAQNNYQQALATLAPLRKAVDTFFDDVMVMSEDEALKNNRLALLNQLRNAFLAVADISCLAAIN